MGRRFETTIQTLLFMHPEGLTEEELVAEACRRSVFEDEDERRKKEEEIKIYLPSNLRFLDDQLVQKEGKFFLAKEYQSDLICENILTVHNDLVGITEEARKAVLESGLIIADISLMIYLGHHIQKNSNKSLYELALEEENWILRSGGSPDYVLDPRCEEDYCQAIIQISYRAVEAALDFKQQAKEKINFDTFVDDLPENLAKEVADLYQKLDEEEREMTHCYPELPEECEKDRLMRAKLRVKMDILTQMEEIVENSTISNSHEMFVPESELDESIASETRKMIKDLSRDLETPEAMDIVLEHYQVDAYHPKAEDFEVEVKKMNYSKYQRELSEELIAEVKKNPLKQETS
ncbi:MAG: hypothetical protein KAT43_00005 [Nanoarchaeota archaeon]|nr:hypothetical protein [Nanoarchaeota archaeon]